MGIIGWGAPLPEASALTRDKAGAGDSQETDDPLTILCVGRLGRHKGQEWLLNVYLEARSRFQRNARLVLVGRDEGDEEKLRELVRESALEGEVQLVGEVSDEELAAWYARSDLFLLFSHYEAFGLVFFEAMAYGTPVLTHDVGANRELLTRGAVVIPRFDPQEAGAQLVRLVNDGEYRRELGQDAQEYALAEFTWNAVGEKYLRVYHGG
jgi:glycosyltransferase involved in cell wall biosynthesis